MENENSKLNFDPILDMLKRPIGGIIRYNNIDIIFAFEPSNRISFQMSSLCEAFQISPDIFENTAEYPSTEIFISEYEIFSSPLAIEPKFKKWYFETANPLFRHFNHRLEMENKKRYIQQLKYQIYQMEKALKEESTINNKGNVS